jgi:hypothetical protein
MRGISEKRKLKGRKIKKKNKEGEKWETEQLR